VLVKFIALPLSLRLLVIVALSIVLARFINWAIYTWAYNRRDLGPWSGPPAVKKSTGTRGSSRSKKPQAASLAPRVWLDHLPMIGWYRLRSEGSEYGKWYWVRPLLIELIFPIAMAWYYQFYVSGQPLQTRPILRVLAPELHWQFIGHAVLFTLMMIATFIDFDEQSIPDYVTVPGTVIGLLGAALAPAWLPFNLVSAAGVEELHAAIPNPWPMWLDGPKGLLIGLLIIGVWGFALLDRRVIRRRGLVKAVQYFFAIMFRNRTLWRIVVLVSTLLAIFVALCWQWKIGRWEYLLSSLFGLAFAGGVTWGVRISASYGLGVEALGFGDVTLMAMIGTYVGWQPSLMIFFVAPFVAIAFVLVRRIVTGRADTPYGPYLCAATALLLIYWDEMWTQWVAPVFELGSLIVGIVAACVVLMGALLWILRLVKQGLGLNT
jgi:leader peptidase (prepilin peptidase) / N-methyltransferase